jgi:hypothetical protein
MAKKKTIDETYLCPIGRFFYDLEKTVGKDSSFLNHVTKSRVEFLKALRSLLDESIEKMEKKTAGKKGGKATKINVE